MTSLTPRRLRRFSAWNCSMSPIKPTTVRDLPRLTYALTSDVSHELDDGVDVLWGRLLGHHDNHGSLLLWNLGGGA